MMVLPVPIAEKGGAWVHCPAPAEQTLISTAPFPGECACWQNYNEAKAIIQQFYRRCSKVSTGLPVREINIDPAPCMTSILYI